MKLLAHVIVLVLATCCWGQTSIALRKDVTLSGPGPVTLGQLAEVSGPEADRLVDVVILDDGPAIGEARVELAEVRAALVRERVNLGRITLSGSAATVRSSEQVPVKAVEASSDQPGLDPDRPEAGTVHAGLNARLAELFAVEPSDLRLKLPGLTAEQRALLSATSGGRRVEVHPGASGTSGRVPLRVEIYRGDRLEQTALLTAEVQIRHRGVAPSTAVTRQQALDDAMLVDSEAWRSPADAVPLGRGAVVGQLAKRRLDAGRLITAEDLQSPVVVSRGDVVLVHCLSGGVVVKAKARALAAARDGELVRLQLEGGGKTFQARVNGRGRAVLNLDAPEAGDVPGGGADTPDAGSDLSAALPPMRKANRRP
jgi:flagella basal body P-ring formation protein FlgA